MERSQSLTSRANNGTAVADTKVIVFQSGPKENDSCAAENCSPDPPGCSAAVIIVIVLNFTGRCN
jgi:hypothetical protein